MNHWTGKKHTAETRKKQSEAKKKNPVRYWLGKKRPNMEWLKNPEVGRKISKARMGHSVSKEARQKISKVQKGKHHSPRTEFKKGQRSVNFGKKRPERTGVNNPNWKGGKVSENLKIRHSVEMKLWRIAVFERDNYTCVFCFKRGGELNADHIKPFALFPELRFAIDNGRTLCVPCHRTTYGKFKNN